MMDLVIFSVTQSVYVVYVVTKGCGYTFPYLCYVVLSENWFASGSLREIGMQFHNSKVLRRASFPETLFGNSPSTLDA